jgi:hypothetical protein
MLTPPRYPQSVLVGTYLRYLLPLQRSSRWGYGLLVTTGGEGGLDSNPVRYDRQERVTSSIR